MIKATLYISFIVICLYFIRFSNAQDHCKDTWSAKIVNKNALPAPNQPAKKVFYLEVLGQINVKSRNDRVELIRSTAEKDKGKLVFNLNVRATDPKPENVILGIEYHLESSKAVNVFEYKNIVIRYPNGKLVEVKIER